MKEVSSLLLTVSVCQRRCSLCHLHSLRAQEWSHPPTWLQLPPNLFPPRSRSPAPVSLEVTSWWITGNTTLRSQTVISPPTPYAPRQSKAKWDLYFSFYILDFIQVQAKLRRHPNEWNKSDWGMFFSHVMVQRRRDPGVAMRLDGLLHCPQGRGPWMFGADAWRRTFQSEGKWRRESKGQTALF